MPLLNKALRATAVACNVGLLALALAVVVGNVPLAGKKLEVLLTALVVISPSLSLASWFAPPFPSEERRLRAAIRVAELQKQLRELQSAEGDPR